MTGRRRAVQRMAILAIVVLAFAVAALAGRGVAAAVVDEHPADIPALGDTVDGPAVLPVVVTAAVALVVLGTLFLRLPTPVPAAVRVPGRRRAPPSSR